MTLKHQLAWLILYDFSTFVHNVVKGLVAEFLDESELPQHADLNLYFLRFSVSPNLVLEYVLINLEQNTFLRSDKREDLAH